MTNYRLRKTEIIKSARRFNEIFKEGQRFSSEYFLLIVVKAENRKVGFAVSKKIRGAVRRNRAKRRTRELYRLNQDLLPENMHIIVMAKPGVERAKSHVLRKEFISLVEKVNSAQ